MRLGTTIHPKGLPFFLPSRLIDFEYFSTEDQDSEYKNLAKPYQKDMDFAFFAVNFGYSKADYEDLTPRERMFILKEWESKTVSDTTHMRNAFMNGYMNARRKKNKRLIPLWKKKGKRADRDIVKTNLQAVLENQKKEGRSWIELIYQKNGLRQKGEERNG